LIKNIKPLSTDSALGRFCCHFTQSSGSNTGYYLSMFLI